jgi:hypothetical protein
MTTQMVYTVDLTVSLLCVCNVESSSIEFMFENYGNTWNVSSFFYWQTIQMDVGTMNDLIFLLVK